jgi:hypothetical protein
LPQALDFDPFLARFLRITRRHFRAKGWTRFCDVLTRARSRDPAGQFQDVIDGIRVDYDTDKVEALAQPDDFSVAEFGAVTNRECFTSESAVLVHGNFDPGCGLAARGLTVRRPS